MPSKPAKEDAKSISVNNYIAAVVAGVMVVVVVCGLSLYYLTKSIILDGKLIGHQNTAKKELQKNVVNAENLVSAYYALGVDKDLILDALPVDTDFPQLVAISENISNAAGVRLMSVSPTVPVATESDSTNSSQSVPSASASSGADTPPANSPIPYQFTIAVTGNYAGMAKFAENLELSARPMRIVDATFKGETSNLTVTFIIETYYQNKADVSTKTGVVK